MANGKPKTGNSKPAKGRIATDFVGDGLNPDPKKDLTTESTESTEGKDVRAARSSLNSIIRMKFPCETSGSDSPCHTSVSSVTRWFVIFVLG
jgi:hypothetical protein